MTQQPRPAPEQPGAGLDVSERAGSDTLYAFAETNDARDRTGPALGYTLAEAVESFLFHCRYEKNLSPKTLAAYGTDLGQFTAFVGNGAARLVVEVGKPVLRAYIQGLYTRLAEKSVKRKVATLKALFHFLEREDAVPLNPFRKMDVRIKETKRLPRTVPLAQVEELFRHLYALRLADADRESARYRTLVRDLAVVEMLFATAARVSEVCHLRAEDVNLEEGCVRILGKGGRERMIQVCDPETLATLRDYRAADAPERPGRYFFRNLRGGRLSEQSVRVLLKRRAREVGLAGRVTPHMFRHSVATFLLEEGVDIRYIQTLLGHTSITTTQIYTQVNDSQQRKILSSRHPRRHFRHAPAARGVV